MPPKPKPNGFSVFVEEKCRAAGVHRTAGFQLFNNEWMALDESIKENYKEKAKALKAAVPVCPVISAISKVNKPRPDRLLEGIKRALADEDQTDSCDRLPPYERSKSSSAPVSPPKKRIFIGEQDGDHIMVVDDENLALGPLNFSELTVTTPEESFENVVQAYANLQQISELSVISFSCIPVVSSVGYKKAQILPIDIPLEVAIAGFDLRDGMMADFYHTYVAPGPLPPGTNCDADETRNDRHGLPWSASDLAGDSQRQFFDHGEVLEPDYLMIYVQILDFVGYDCRTHNVDQLMPLCCRSADLKVNELCIRWLHQEAKKRLAVAGPDALSGWKVKELPEFKFATLEDFSKLAMVYKMRSKSVSVPCGTEDSLNAAFGVFGFYKQLHNLNCWYHRKVTSVKHCALGAARETCFIVMNYLKNVFSLPDDHHFVYMGGPHHDDSDDDE